MREACALAGQLLPAPPPRARALLRRAAHPSPASREARGQACALLCRLEKDGHALRTTENVSIKKLTLPPQSSGQAPEPKVARQKLCQT